MNWRDIIHGIRVGLRRYRCTHPAMQHATIAVVGSGHCTGIWYCPECGKTLPDSGPVTVTR